MTSRARYEFSGYIPPEQYAEDVRDQACAMYPEGWPIGYMYDDAGIMLSRIESYEQGLLMLDAAVRDGRITPDNAWRVTESMRADNQLLRTLYTFDMSSNVDEDGRAYATVSVFGTYRIKSKAHGRKIIEDGIEQRKMHVALKSEHLERIEQLQLPETLLGVEQDEEWKYHFTDCTGKRLSRFSSQEEAYGELNAACREGYITLYERETLMQMVNQLFLEDKIEGNCFDIYEEVNDDGEDALRLYGPGSGIVGMRSVNAALAALRTLSANGWLTSDRCEELSQKARACTTMPKTLTSIISCPDHPNDAHMHIVGEDGNTNASVIYSKQQARKLITTFVANYIIAEESVDTLERMIDQSALPDTHETDEIAQATLDLLIAIDRSQKR